MPAPGDQHRDTPASVNPFADNRPHITEFTAQEIATLQSRLDKQLGPEYISTRPGNGGGKVHYLAAEKVINLANEVFGFNGWSSQIQNVQIDFVDENPQNGRINLGLSTIVRVTLRDGTFHEDIGYGHCENTKGKAAAFEKAKKEAATDAMKRALRNFGNVLGNCLYDKDYLSRVAKVKAAPSRWDAQNLHRHPDFAPIKKELASIGAPISNQPTSVRRNISEQSARSAASIGSGEFEDDFGGNIFDETDFTNPDEVHLDDTTVMAGAPSPAPRRQQVHPQQNGQAQGLPRTSPVPQTRAPNIQPPAQVQGLQAPQRPQTLPRPPPNAGQPQNKMPPPHTPGNHQRPTPQQNQDGTRSNPSSGTTNGSSTNQAAGQAEELNFPMPRQPPQGIPEGFVTGRKADLLNQPGEQRPIGGSIAFNPHADSPSIRRTPGMNPGKSAPVERRNVSGENGNGNGTTRPAGPSTISGAGFQSPQTNGMNGAQRPAGANFVNPSADANRRIGMPQSGGMQNRGAYRPPTAIKRPAMSDVTNIQQVDGASDAKKPRMDTSAQDENAQDPVVT